MNRAARLHSKYALPSNKQTRNHIAMPRRAQGARTASPPIHRHRRAAVPGSPTVTTFHLSQGPRPAPRSEASRGRHSDRNKLSNENPSALSSSSASGYQPEARTARHCPAAASASRKRELLLRPHSHSAAFESRGRPSRAPGTTPAATELPGLAILVFPSVTSLARQRQADSRCTPSLPAWRSFPQARMSHDGTADFSGPNAEAAAYPST